jgi:RNA polymerase sigma-70 factor (ECF subfamily)
MILGDRALAEDAVQQAFTRLLARGRMDDLESAQAYLRVMVRNEAYRLLARRRPAQMVEDTPAPLLEPADDAIERGEEQAQLEAALRQLSPEQREVVHMKVYEQLTFAQIGTGLGIPQNTAASRYRYAIEHLRELLAAPRTGP